MLRTVTAILSTLLFTSMLLSGCSLIPVHQVTIQQGNIITPQTVRQLRPGLTQQQVRAIMGTPLLINTFGENTMHYVYTLKVGHQPMTLKKMTLIFKDGRLVRW